MRPFIRSRPSRSAKFHRPAKGLIRLSFPAGLAPLHPLTAFQISQASPARQGPYPPVIPSGAFALLIDHCSQHIMLLRPPIALPLCHSERERGISLQPLVPALPPCAGQVLRTSPLWQFRLLSRLPLSREVASLRDAGGRVACPCRRRAKHISRPGPQRNPRSAPPTANAIDSSLQLRFRSE